MSKRTFDVKPIHLLFKNADGASTDVTDHDQLHRRFTALSVAVNDSYRQRYGGANGQADAIGLIAILGEFLPLMQSLNGEYGSDGELPMGDTTQTPEQFVKLL